MKSMHTCTHDLPDISATQRSNGGYRARLQLVFENDKAQKRQVRLNFVPEIDKVC